MLKNTPQCLWLGVEPGLLSPEKSIHENSDHETTVSQSCVVVLLKVFNYKPGIKNDFSGHLHKFMANLTDTRYKMQGKTVLYVPNEGNRLSVEEAAKRKEFVQRLESE